MKLFVENLRYESATYRAPYKFGASVVSDLLMPVVTVRLVQGRREGVGTGAMPLGNAWSFPAAPPDQSLAAMRRLGEQTARAVHGLETEDSIFALSHEVERIVMGLAASIGPIPKLCSLVVFSPFDIAAFDAWGQAHQANTFVLLRELPEAETLARWLDEGFRDFGLNRVLPPAPRQSLALFHSVGGLDALTAAEVSQPIGDGWRECWPIGSKGINSPT